jgi:hypothetical protein
VTEIARGPPVTKIQVGGSSVTEISRSYVLFLCFVKCYSKNCRIENVLPIN